MLLLLLLLLSRREKCSCEVWERLSFAVFFKKEFKHGCTELRDQYGIWEIGVTMRILANIFFPCLLVFSHGRRPGTTIDGRTDGRTDEELIGRRSLAARATITDCTSSQSAKQRRYLPIPPFRSFSFGTVARLKDGTSANCRLMRTGGRGRQFWWRWIDVSKWEVI